MAMIYRDMKGNQNYWEKKCTSTSWCEKNDEQVCGLKDEELGGYNSIKKCRKVCSAANDVNPPEFKAEGEILEGSILNLHKSFIFHYRTFFFFFCSN